jgi:ATP-binding cassette subfamily C exporter for protease/lipase
MSIKTNNNQQVNYNLFNCIIKSTPLINFIVLITFILGVLSLVPTVFMLSVYDRVLTSKNITTLVMLMGLVVISYALMEVLEYLRAKMLLQVTVVLNEKHEDILFNRTFEGLLQQNPLISVNVLNDFKLLKDFICSSALVAILDAPMSLLFLLIIMIISPLLGLVALACAGLQIWIFFNTEKITMPTIEQASLQANQSIAYAGQTMRNATLIESMGMYKMIARRWHVLQTQFLINQAKASDNAGRNSAISRFMMLFLSSTMLGASCWLTLKGQMLGGASMMIVASILGGKVLTPLSQLVVQWRTVSNARTAYQRIQNLFNSPPMHFNTVSLPAPQGHVTFENVTAWIPNTPQPVLRNLSFTINPGECIAIIGPSGSGKTTLAKLILGILAAHSGSVRIDGIDAYQWKKDELGIYLGYLPQAVDLMGGTVIENITRFGKKDKEALDEVIKLTGISLLIASLPNELDTPIFDNSQALSGGQAQRIGLARAVYGRPRLVVLDEPNSNLDAEGEIALGETLRALKEQNCTVLIITHRIQALQNADKIMMLKDGQIAAFGPKQDILAAIEQAQIKNQQKS